ncbi:transporter substrate-binding domain-containing protein [Acidisoma sp. 7E03]
MSAQPASVGTASQIFPPGHQVTVGVAPLPPFAMEVGGHYTGLAVDLWQDAATRMALSYRYVAYPNFEQLLQAVISHQVDLAAVDVTITKSRLQEMDLTQPWFDGGLRVMIDQDRHQSFGSLVHALWVSGHVRVYLWLLGLILLGTLVLTLIDRRFDEEFPRSWGAGLSHSFYHVMSIATSGRASAHKPMFGSWGRVLAAIWMIFGTLVVAYVTSSVTSVMTTTTLLNQINGVADLGGKTVGVVQGTVGEAYCLDAALNTQSYPDLPTAVAALVKHRVDAVVSDAALLEYYDNSHPELPITEVGALFRPAKYGFALPLGSPLTRPLSVQLLAEQESGFIGRLKRRYLGSEP